MEGAEKNIDTKINNGKPNTPNVTFTDTTDLLKDNWCNADWNGQQTQTQTQTQPQQNDNKNDNNRKDLQQDLVMNTDTAGTRY